MATPMPQWRAARQTAPLRAAMLANLAVDALLDEAELAPKPGLVDARGSGAHTDLTLALMRTSAYSLRPAFTAMAAAALEAGAPGQTLRERLGALGRDAEAAMMAATGGINTHRGAIWCLGLLVAGAALVPMRDASASDDRTGDGATRDDTTHVRPAAARVAASMAASVADTAAAIARHADRFRPEHTGNKGELACRAYGVNGARGQAEAGFPHVIRHGLPMLHASRARGDAEPSARVNALLAIMATLDDTCVLARAGTEGLAHMQAGAAAVLDAGGIGTLCGRRQLHGLEAGMLARRASPGGAADLLAATLFLDRLPLEDGARYEDLHGD
ncbi:triphosphoribosyl-dephospho-CoA synthase [Cupriavidus plantarum]|uniref:triphosphoribosyl-dephospho-CoA synthase n=1 Tax=Cupriavidus plantarum TaxID=942865 RepID=UPI001B1F854D|nr:triphosphoribosyl-dephospho-CoA synthase [Cupriavidus plantarum]CAG2145866.1 2-(5''-triphosphoribosyl)-3'-dephosphocoenzyme-A synthase [Cupriavidus plantarum]SMR86678.1 triphosphoribosyl-dephospho-CoA synthase [Cupriavidus plantarum]